MTWKDLSFFQSTNPIFLSKCTHFRSYTARLSKTLLLLPTGRCAPVQMLPKATRKKGSTHSPYYCRDCWSQCTRLEFSNIYHLRNILQSGFSQGGAHSFKEQKKTEGEKKCKDKLPIKHLISFNMA